MLAVASREVLRGAGRAGRDTPILMYCTGGIRCDVYSAKLREEGFTQMYTLEGGVQRFLQEEGRQMWDGELFVFDDRLATPNMPRDDGEGMQPHEFNRKCLCCGGKKAAPPHRNCANVDCNRLFLCVPAVDRCPELSMAILGKRSGVGSVGLMNICVHAGAL